jgi:rhamnosyltransferase
MKKLSIGVMFMTYNAEHHLKYCLPPVLNTEIVDEVLVVNSSGTDNTVRLAKEMGANVLVLPRKEFNHGATKEIARKEMKSDIIIMMSPDAYGKSGFIEELIRPILDQKAALTYSRQLPHIGAGFYESFPREYNYPTVSELRDLNTLKEKGPEALFCSNSCAAYLVSALDAVGGFPIVLTGEDTIVASRLLSAGFLIKYVAESEVHHSHSSTLLNEFRRHFDAGYSRNIQFKEDLLSVGNDYKKGFDYVKKFLIKTMCLNPFLVPYSLMIVVAKFTGYKLGSKAAKLPLKLKIYFSSQDFYWTSIYYDK